MIILGNYFILTFYLVYKGKGLPLSRLLYIMYSIWASYTPFIYESKGLKTKVDDFI